MIIVFDKFQTTMVSNWPQQGSSRSIPKSPHFLISCRGAYIITIRDCQVLPRTLCKPRTTTGDAWQQRRKMVMSVAPHLHGLEALIATKIQTKELPEMVGCIIDAYTQTSGSLAVVLQCWNPLFIWDYHYNLPFSHVSLFSAWIFVRWSSFEFGRCPNWPFCWRCWHAVRKKSALSLHGSGWCNGGGKNLAMLDCRRVPTCQMMVLDSPMFCRSDTKAPMQLGPETFQGGFDLAMALGTLEIPFVDDDLVSSVFWVCSMDIFGLMICRKDKLQSTSQMLWRYVAL